MRQTKIVATLGPKTVEKEEIKKLAQAGVDVFRINLSHGERNWHEMAVNNIKEASPEVKILLDTRGPEIRTGDLKSIIKIKEGEIFYLVIDQNLQNEEQKKIFVAYSQLCTSLKVGEKVAIDGGMLMTEVLSVSADTVELKAKNDWQISSRRHINLPGERLELPALTEKDIADLDYFSKKGIVDYIAMSFVQTADDVRQAKKLCPNIKIIAKIENQEGMNNFSQILEEAEGIMVARGDLGVELPLESIPVIQRRMVREAREKNKFIIVATEMLESMIENPRPTRAEVSDVATAVWEGADAVMLSQETAMGAYPIRAVEIMRKIIEFTEQEMKLLP